MHSDLSSTKSLSKNHRRSSAILDRGLMVHSKETGTGQLFQTVTGLTYRIKPTWWLGCSREGSITLPSLSTDLERFDVDRTVAAVSQRVEVAICVPTYNLHFSLISFTTSSIGTILFYRRPNLGYHGRIVDILIKLSVFRKSFGSESRWGDNRLHCKASPNNQLSWFTMKHLLHNYAVHTKYWSYWRSQWTR